MYQKVTTEGIVLRKRGVGEANMRAYILTQGLGLVVASARSARRVASKLRYGLEPLTLARFCFVHGAHEWRVTEASAVNNLATASSEARAAMGRIAQLLLRLIHGQEANTQLYTDVKEGFRLIASAEHGSLNSIEVVLVLRILSHLGYLPRTEALAPFVENDFSLELSAKALTARALLVRAINESLQATGL